MALVKGNITADVRTPAGSSYSFSHNQNVGADGYLFVTIACPSVNVSSVTYGNVAMTAVQTQATTYSAQWTVWKLAAPATGNNTLLVTLNSGSWNSTSTYCTSFTGCSGNGNTAYDGVAANPVDATITISANSMILGAVIGGNSTTANIEMPQGTARTLDYTHNINNFTWGAVSPSLSAGSVICEANATATNIIMLTEIQEAGGGVGARRKIWIV